MPKTSYYAVRKGREPGIYTTWNEASKQVTGVPKTEHKKFSTLEEAQKYLKDVPYKGPPLSSTTFSLKPVNTARDKGFENFTTSNSKERIVYCDGACSGNGKKMFHSKAGIGIYWDKVLEGEKYKNLEEKLPGPPTNNRAELYAIIRVFETDPRPELPLLIKTDSSYSISCIETYAFGWKKNGWRKADGSEIKNLVMIRYILHLIENHPGKVKFAHVKGHAGIKGNEMADMLANNGANKPTISDKDYENMLLNWKEAIGLERPRKRRAREVDCDINPDDLYTAEELERIAVGENSS